MIGNLEQAAKDLQAWLSGLAGGVPVYEREAPRDKSESIAVEPPFVVYTADMRAPDDESGEWTFDLFIDVWALNSYADCYRVMMMIDDGVHGSAHVAESGSFCGDRNGLCYQRGEKDPADERIRRMSGQYLVRFNSR